MGAASTSAGPTGARLGRGRIVDSEPTGEGDRGLLRAEVARLDDIPTRELFANQAIVSQRPDLGRGVKGPRRRTNNTRRNEQAAGAF